MKKLSSMGILLLASANILAQGTIILSNQNLTDQQGVRYQAPVNGDTTELSAQLFLVGSGGILTPLIPTTVFQTGAGAAYLVPQTVAVPGIEPGGAASFLLRVWSGASYDSAAMRAESAPFRVDGLGGLTENGTIQPPPLNGLQSFGLCVGCPEPRFLALATLGFGILLLRRKRAESSGNLK